VAEISSCKRCKTDNAHKGYVCKNWMRVPNVISQLCWALSVVWNIQNIHDVSETDSIPISERMVFLLKHNWLVSSRLFKLRVPRTITLLPSLINRDTRSERVSSLSKLSVATFIQLWWQINVWVWSMGEMILTGRNRSTQRKTSPRATLSTINPTWLHLAKNKGLWG
jgi:hypothetical protein